MARVLAMSPKRQRSMERRVYRLRNVIPGFARTAFVAIAGVSVRAKLVRRRKKVAASMAYAAPLPTTKIPTKNAGAARVMAPAFANNTTAFLARANRSVCPGIASTASVAEISATLCVLHVPLGKKDKASMASAGPLRSAETSTTNALPANAMAEEHAFNRKLHSQMVRCVSPAHNAHQAIASKAFVAKMPV